ncbi:MAG TPA: hypothetical protein VJX67_19840 [Blastocatellia bacterium]|nr:hypothetical protein [Blastocatellia bacterium]
MKFRRTCSACNATFFSPDRKASLCLKCSKKRAIKHVRAVATAEVKTSAEPLRVSPRPVPRPLQPPLATGRRSKGPRPPKASVLTAELREKITELYEGEFSSKQAKMREVNATIAERLWVKRKVVADVLREINQSKAQLTDELRKRAIEMYQRFVENGHRPEGGRRRAISAAFSVPYKQVMNLIREWSLAEYSKSPTPTPSRQQLFEVEKTYWRELAEQRSRLTELPGKIADELGHVTRWQVLRWLDVLHDDERVFANVPDPPEEVRQQIIDAYQKYLEADSPPEHGLHYTIAAQIDKVTPRQVHKVLQNHRHKMRTEYPHI